jgi:hypothetical protein
MAWDEESAKRWGVDKIFDHRLADMGEAIVNAKHDPTKTTPAEKAKAVATFQQWTDDDNHARKQVESIFHDRRPHE